LPTSSPCTVNAPPALFPSAASIPNRTSRELVCCARSGLSYWRQFGSVSGKIRAGGFFERAVLSRRQDRTPRCFFLSPQPPARLRSPHAPLLYPAMASTKLFVGSLAWATTDESLKQAFEVYGNVRDQLV